MSGVIVRTCAKVNLCLRVMGRRRDGYHNVQTVLQAIGLWDCLNLLPLEEEKRIVLRVTGEEVPSNGTNLCWQAAQVLAEHARMRGGVAIELQKTIPVAAGLGGASSDAAATLAGLARLWCLDLKDDALEALGAEIGSDVPFFLRGGCCLGRETGEKLDSLPAPVLWLVVVTPDQRVPTAKAYAALDRGASRGRRRALSRAVRRAVDAVKSGDPGAVAQVLHNDFEDLRMPGLEEAREAKAALLRAGCLGASVSGSGSAVFGIAADREIAEEVASGMRDRWTWVQVARSLQAREGMVISELAERPQQWSTR